MKKIRTLLILTSFMSLFLFQNSKAQGPEITNTFEYIDTIKDKIDYKQLIPKEKISIKNENELILLEKLKVFLMNTLGENNSDKEIKLKIYNINELFSYTSIYETCLNKLFPNLNKNKILEYKTKYLFNLFVINKDNLHYKYFEIYENLKDTLKSKVSEFLKEKTESNFLEMKEAFKNYNKIFLNEINSNSSIQLVKLNSTVIKNLFMYMNINKILFPVDEILINIFIPQILKITYNYYLTFKFVLNKLTLKEQEDFKEKSIIPYELFFTNDFIKEKKLNEISSSLENLNEIEETAKTLSINKKFFSM